MKNLYSYVGYTVIGACIWMPLLLARADSDAPILNEPISNFIGPLLFLILFTSPLLAGTGWIVCNPRKALKLL